MGIFIYAFTATGKSTLAKKYKNVIDMESVNYKYLNEKGGLLVKIVDTNKKYNMNEQIPYESAKPMYLVDDIDNKELLKEIVNETCKGLPIKK